VLLAHQVDGEPLSTEHGGPLRSVCNGKYFYKSVKWLKRIDLLGEDHLGYWERTSSYHNGADPKTEQRYESRPMSEADFTACIKALNFSNIQAVRDDKFARLGTEKIDLTGANFEGAEIKACDFRHALLRATKCSGANFTKSTFRYA